MLVKQNGTFDGSDVSDLLIGLLQKVSGVSEPGRLLSSLSTSRPPPTEEVVEEFHNFMSTGRIKDGLDHAISSKLWGHAFMIGGIMGEKWLSYVQTKYQQSLGKNDPMRTLYAHLHNKDVDYIKRRAHVDTWVENLCMLVSQTSGFPERDKERIIGFGDSLRDMDLTAAAHLCYLIAEVPFGGHECEENRITLLGLEHRKQIHCRTSVWAQPLNTPLTEVYIYARTLHEKNFTIPQYQRYKYEYAMQLAEYGFSVQGLAYLESIGQVIILDKTNRQYTTGLCANVIRYAKDLLLLDTDKYEDLETPSWLDDLEVYMQNSVVGGPDRLQSTGLEDRKVSQHTDEVQQRPQFDVTNETNEEHPRFETTDNLDNLDNLEQQHQ
jgi:hypothetical protein